jgi:prepilin-type processing-associated H-X9-DG protein
MNAYIGGVGSLIDTASPARVWRRLDLVCIPSRSYLVLDKGDKNANNTGLAGSANGQYPAYRHSQMVNVLFADGHCSPVIYAQTQSSSYYFMNIDKGIDAAHSGWPRY